MHYCRGAGSVELSHELVVEHPLGKILLSERRRVRPRLEPVLLADRRREAAAPSAPGERRAHIFPGRGVHDLRAAAHVVVDGC